MSAKLVVGKISVKFFRNGNPVGTDFNSENVQMSLDAFAASETNRKVGIGYGQKYPDGVHTLSVSPQGPARLDYIANGPAAFATGIITLTVSKDQDRQDGEIDVTILDDLGRPVNMKGTYEAEYSFNK
ncbi:hypothetical protein [Pseudomonas fluorescens]|uniref:Uncharacterized protein n=1 Tax=Pseudomonas fluorescens TaxID=294 RepID=A0A0F4SUN4_PSEFL|nr:hypothetical protein [Pseudomonas fluorescens]KJZ34837.1 hypothetical protein VC34_28150 [Pseudomonas fluorescens]